MNNWIAIFMEKIPMQLISVFLSALIPLSVSYFIFKSMIKYKNKKIKLDSPITVYLKIVMISVAIIPVYTMIFQIITYNHVKESTLGIFFLFLILIIGLIIFGGYLRILKKYNAERLKDTEKTRKRIWNITKMYVCSILVLAASLVITMLLSIGSLAIVKQMVGSEEFSIDIIISYVFLYIFNILVIYIPYLFAKANLIKFVEEIRIFYNQNGKIMSDLNIRYEDFDVNKHFISFYSCMKGYRRVIQTKDLLRIEYYYKD